MTHFFILFGMREKIACFELRFSSVLMQNEHNWNFHSSLTLMTHFFILFGMREKMACFKIHVCLSSVLTQNEGIWNFHGSLTVNKWKLI